MKDKEVMNEKIVAAKIKEIAEAIVEKNKKNISDVVLVGIIQRGSNIAERLVALIKDKAGKEIPCGKLDVSIYRDDLNIRGEKVTIRSSDIPVDIQDKIVVLIDDVVFKGRTTLAAMNVLHDYGRPKEVQLYALVDRGGRELPIQPTFSAETINIDKANEVQVLLKESDGKDQVLIKGAK